MAKSVHSKFSNTLIAVALMSLLYFLQIFSFGLVHLNLQDLEMGDFVDQPLLAAGLAKTTSFAQTLDWWVGPWVAGTTVPFYRPLTSLIWWFEFQAFGGMNGATGFMVVHFLSHFAVCLLLYAFLRRLWGERLALLATLIWESALMTLLSLPINSWALSYWKDDPDIWLTGVVLLCLWALLNYAQQGRRRDLAAIFALQLVAISIKEMSYILPLLMTLLLWYQKRLNLWKIPLAMFLVTVAAYAFRTWALQGSGFRFGSNGAWLARWLLNVIGGPPVALLTDAQTTPLGLALIVVGLALLIRRNWRFGAGLSVVGIGLFVASDPLLALANLVLPLTSQLPTSACKLHREALIAVIVMVGWYSFWKRRERRALFAWLWVALAYAPLMTAPITEHALYLPSIGWAIWGALVLQALHDRFAPRLRFADFRALLNPQANAKVLVFPVLSVLVLLVLTREDFYTLDLFNLSIVLGVLVWFRPTVAVEPV